MSSTKSKMLKGILWITIDKYSGLALSIIVSMVLARLLTPDEFGLLTVASVVLAFIGLLSNMGLGPAIIQEQNLTKKDTNSVFTFTIIVGLVLAGVYFCLSWSIARFYNNAQLVPVCQLLSVSFFFGVINNVPKSLMVKHQRFKEMAVGSIAMNAATGPIAILAAYKGLGVYSLMIAPFLNSVILLFYYRRFYPCSIDWHMSMAPIRRMASFSLYQLGFELVNYFSRNLDKLIIGRWMSIRDLGYYDKSYRLMQQPQNNITSVLTPVLQPNFAQYQHDMGMMARQYLRVISTMAAISFPLGITLCMCGPEIIRLMYGPQWERAIPCFQILCLSLPSAMLTSTTGAIFQASNATKYHFYVGVVNTCCLSLCFFMAAYCYRTIEAVALAWTLFIGIGGLIISFASMFRLVFKQSVLLLFRQLLRPLGNLIMLYVALSLSDALWALPMALSLVTKLMVAALLTGIYMQTTGEYDLVEAAKHLLRRRKKL